MSRDMYSYLRKATAIAKQFHYNESVINAIKNAKSENEISRIMREERLSQEV